MNRTTGIGMPLTRSSTAFTRRSRHSPHLSADYADGFTDAALDAREWEMGEHSTRGRPGAFYDHGRLYERSPAPEPEIHNTFRECLSKAVAAFGPPSHGWQYAVLLRDPPSLPETVVTGGGRDRHGHGLAQQRTE